MPGMYMYMPSLAVGLLAGSMLLLRIDWGWQIWTRRSGRQCSGLAWMRAACPLRSRLEAGARQSS